MRIVADRNIPLAAEACAHLGEVVTLPGRALDAAAVRDAELLLVRSTVKVGPALLDGSRVRFVATATIGIDHLDLDYLARRGIAWAAAPGSNADSVLQWWAAAVLRVGPTAPRLGIVGVGNVGGRVERLARALGWDVLRCDPPRARAEGGDFVPLARVLDECDLVTLHVPLTTDGPDRTVHLVDPARLRPGAWLVNCARGAVVDNAALRDALDGRLGGAILDVFEGEPEPDPRLIAACALATPHIAGHSLDGKWNGTEQVYRAACAFLGVAPRWTRPGDEPGTIALATDGKRDEELVLEALRARYRIEVDDAALRQIVALPPGERARAFAQVRAEYPPRRELRGLRVELSSPRPRAAGALEVLGACLQADT
jgi:erythronate-4-phosphate dehydrogenase